MATRKKASKKAAMHGGTSKKKASRKKASRKKPAAGKKASRKKASRKKPAAGKKVSRKKIAKKAAKKKASGKKVARNKKAPRKASKKKASRKKVTKKTARKKKAVAKKAAKKKTSKKKASRKSSQKTSKKASKKKSSKTTSRKKTVSKKKSKLVKKPAKKASAKKTAAKKSATKAGEEAPTKTIKKAVVKKPAQRFMNRANVAQPMNPADHVPPRPRRRKKVNPDQQIHGIEPYKTATGEDYMNDKQLKHFGNILGAWKAELIEEVDRTVHHMQDEASNFPDPNDRATQESEFSLELRTRDRERKLLKKIDQAINRIDEGDYGFCVETGEEIGLKRLEARPVATLCVEAQERREVAERQYRDSDDRYR
jgi:DnaK suppressor protein